MYGRRALFYKHVSSGSGIKRRRVLTVINGYGPILIERLAPNTKIQDLHDHPARNDVAANYLNCPGLLQAHTTSTLEYGGPFKWNETYVSL
jgi:hypothetical protein